ncbi:Tyrosine N-monooxygenase [Hordeum vulgare]|nr:Tyrosine N-monooxygenase [Hordeum vulgare]
MTAVDKITPSGTNDRDRLNIAQNLFRREEKKTKKGKVKKGRAFVLPHCYKVFKDQEKWKNREDKNNATIDLDDDDNETSNDGGKGALDQTRLPT